MKHTVQLIAAPVSVKERAAHVFFLPCHVLEERFATAMKEAVSDVMYRRRARRSRILVVGQGFNRTRDYLRGTRAHAVAALFLLSSIARVRSIIVGIAVEGFNIPRYQLLVTRKEPLGSRIQCGSVQDIR